MPVLCHSWEDLHTADAPMALVGTGFWEEEQVSQAKDKGMLIMRLDEGHISPYQPADILMKQVYEIALAEQFFLPGAVTTLCGKEVVAVCSPHSYDLQTGFAVVYSLICAEKKSTLYLDFSYYSGFFDASDGDVGDLFYKLHMQTASAGAILAALTRTLGPLDYIPPVTVQMDLDDLTGKDFTELLQRVLQESEYELVVLNLPARPLFLRAVYSCCSRMYSLQREGILYDRAQARLLEDLRLGSGQAKLPNLQIVPMPAISGSFSMEESMYESLLFGEMAIFIREVVLKEESCRTM